MILQLYPSSTASWVQTLNHQDLPEMRSTFGIKPEVHIAFFKNDLDLYVIQYL